MGPAAPTPQHSFQLFQDLCRMQCCIQHGAGECVCLCASVCLCVSCSMIHTACSGPLAGDRCKWHLIQLMQCMQVVCAVQVLDQDQHQGPADCTFDSADLEEKFLPDPK